LSARHNQDCLLLLIKVGKGGRKEKVKIVRLSFRVEKGGKEEKRGGGGKLKFTVKEEGREGEKEERPILPIETYSLMYDGKEEKEGRSVDPVC